MSLIEKIKSLIMKKQIDDRRRIKFSKVQTSPWAISDTISRDEFRKLIKMYREDAVAYSKMIKNGNLSAMRHYTQGQIDAWDIMLEILNDI